MFFKLLSIHTTDTLVWIIIFVSIAVLISFLKDSRAKTRKIIFFGDSITKQGLQPGGYIFLIRDMLAKTGITNYDLVGSGIDGNKVYDLYLRMSEDVIAQSPAIVVIWIGVNDVWHKTTHGTGTDADKFEKFYRSIVQQLQADKIKVVLVTPAVIGEKNDGTNEQDDDLNEYSQVIRNVAKEFDLPLCDLRTLFHSYEVNNNIANAEKGIFTTDGVHLNDAGNRFAAEEIWKVLKDIS